MIKTNSGGDIMLLLSSDTRCKEQHEAIRNTAGWYYFTHHIVEVTGKDAVALLDKVYASNIGKLAPTRGRYSLMLDENGIPQDDCVVFCIEEGKYWISTLHCPRTLKELEEHKGNLDVNFVKRTKELDMYAVQGPKAEEFVKAIVANDPSDLKKFQIKDNKLGDIHVKIAKGSYTGESGYEIYCKIDDSKKVEEILTANQDKFGAKYVDEFDVIAYSLPTEAGFMLVTDIDESTPFETGMDWMIDWNKEDFLGKEKALLYKEQPFNKVLVGITVDESFIKVHGGPYGAPVFKAGKQIGRVTKFTYGFTFDKWVGFALVEADSVKIGDHVTLNWDVDAVVSERPLLKK